jgi:ABC-2 type transport system ATP-binding protein
MSRLILIALLAALALAGCGSSSSSSSYNPDAGSNTEADDGNGGDTANDDTPVVTQDADADGVPDSEDNCPAVANARQDDGDSDGAGDLCDLDDPRDSDADGVVNNNDLCADTPSGEAVAENGCAESQLNAACGDSFASVEAGRHYQVTQQSASGERISFEVFEPAQIQCGQRSAGRHPLILQAHGFGGARVSDTANPEYESTGIKALHEAGYVVISVDQRGFGDSSGTVRVLDPDVEGLDALQILDWAEANLDYLAWRDEASGAFAYRPDSGVSEPGGNNLLVGAVGGSYGGGFQLMLHAIDEKQRLDALAPDVTWHHLPYALNPGDVPKSDWMLLLVAGGESGSYPPGFENQDSPLARGLDPYVLEGLGRALALNEVPRDALDWLAYHSPSYWCGLNAQPVMPYAVMASDINNNLSSFANELPGGNTYSGQPGVDVLLTQGIRDTLFNFNEAWWNYLCLSERAAGSSREVRLFSHESGHNIAGYLGETPDPLYTQAAPGNRSCGGVGHIEAAVAWFNEKLRGGERAEFFQADGICMSLADDDAVMIPYDQFKARRFDGAQAAPAFYALEDIVIENVLNGAESQAAHLLGQAAVIQPLLTVTGARGLIVAGIPQLDLTVTTPQMLNDVACASGAEVPTIRSGCDSITFVGLAVDHGDGEWRLLDDQISPIRGLGEHLDTDLVGVAERLAQGDRLGIWVSGYHPQYIEAFSRDVTIPAVNLKATLRLPLYAVSDDGSPDFAVAPAASISTN